MEFKAIASLAALLAVTIGIPIWMFLCLRSGFSAKQDSKSRTAIGNALQELDRLITRPSIEHKVEAEDQITVVDDERSD